MRIFPPNKLCFSGPGGALASQNLRAGTGICRFPWSPVASRGLPLSPVLLLKQKKIIFVRDSGLFFLV